MATESDHKLAKESATLAGQLLLLLRDIYLKEIYLEH